MLFTCQNHLAFSVQHAGVIDNTRFDRMLFDFTDSDFEDVDFGVLNEVELDDMPWEGMSDGKKLQLAARAGDLRIVTILVEEFNANVNYKGPQGWTPVMEACLRGRFEVLRYLINTGRVDRYSLDQGIVWASENGHSRVVKYLLENRASPNSLSNGGWTPLIVATKSNHLDIVRLLVKHGASLIFSAPVVEHPDSPWPKLIPLNWALRAGNLRIAKFLWRAGNRDPVHVDASQLNIMNWFFEKSQRFFEKLSTIENDFSSRSLLKNKLKSASIIWQRPG